MSRAREAPGERVLATAAADDEDLHAANLAQPLLRVGCLGVMRRVALAIAMLVTCGAVAHAQPGDWTVRRDPFDRTVIARYKAILARTPHDAVALSALVSLYRRHRTLDLLVHEYEAARTDGEEASEVVVLARLARARGDSASARAGYRRATELAPDDVLAWTALGELARTAGERGAARDAFAQVAARTTSKARRIGALRELADLAADTGDANATEQLYRQLADLLPRDGKLQLDRGDALLRLGLTGLARDAYAAAEKLLARDPERRLLAIAALGTSFERDHDRSLAIAEYERAIAASPPRYYLRRELRMRIANLHEAAGDVAALRAVLEHTVREEPTDDVSQWRLIRLYDKQGDFGLALTQLHAAVKAAPRDVALVIELAQRYAALDAQVADEVAGTHVPARRAERLLSELSRAHPRDAEAHAAIGEVYLRWRATASAVREYKRAVALASDERHLVALGDAHMENGDLDEAIEAWRRITASKTPTSYARFAMLLLEHDLWQQARDAFTTAMFHDDKNPLLWRGRAIAFAQLSDLGPALDDAEHAVELLGPVAYARGLEVRSTFVRLLEQNIETTEWHDGSDRPLREHILAWAKAFHGPARDRQSGYLLAVYLSRHPGTAQRELLKKLRALVPDDDELALELVRAHRLAHEYDEAIAIVESLAKRDPRRAQDHRALIATIETDRKRHTEAETARALVEADAAEEARLAERWARRDDSRRVPLVATARLGLGAGVSGDAARTLTLGSWDAVPIARGFEAIVRADWTQHVARMRSVNAAALGLGVGRPQLVSRNTAITIAAGARAERRFGELTHGSWERWAFSADVAVDVTSRHLPASIGVRYEQPIADAARGPTLFVEIAVGLRCLDLSAGSAACR
jgi:tetratricopeptide (TPR) repeat protein